MLPVRKSAPVPRRVKAIAAEVRVPSEGTWFAALAASVRADGLFLSTFQELPAGTAVVVELSLPGGSVTVDGFVEHYDGDGPGVRVAFEGLDEEIRSRIEASAPEPRVTALVA
jgi:hypothetical protein